MRYPYEIAPTKEVGLALWVLERNHWNWERFGSVDALGGHLLASKARALVAHDRILCGELASRGLPKVPSAGGAS